LIIYKMVFAPMHPEIADRYARGAGLEAA